MVLLQETKRSTIDEKFVRSIWSRDPMDFMAVDSEGVAGGLLCIWNPEVFQLVDCCSNRNFIILSEANVEGWAGFKCLQKLKILKLALKLWVKEVFGDVEHKLNEVEEEIHTLDIIAKERPLSEAEKTRRR
ncbi:hypothetical protein ACSBR2_035345 [Camellia fascicularis]